MEIKKLVDTINRTYISSDYLRQPDIYYYMDRVIDDINENLQSLSGVADQMLKIFRKQLQDIITELRK